MLYFIGLDSFDTAFAGCTTHFASLLIHLLARDGLHPADYPWLVRLNPAVPWKTRGNGAVSLIFYGDRGDASKIVLRVKELTKAYMIDRTGKASLVILKMPLDDPAEALDRRQRCLEEVYRRALRKPVPHDMAAACLGRLSENTVFAFNPEARGLVGALAALGASWSDDYTYELIVYRKVSFWHIGRVIDPLSVIEYDLATRPLTFMNYDYELSRILVAPHGYDPVLYGVRGENPHILLKALTMIRTKEEPSHWTLFRSNQGTNAHLHKADLCSVRPYENPVIAGTVKEVKNIPGGHTVLRLCSESCCLPVAFYRETGRMRQAARLLRPGSIIEVGGQAKPHGNMVTVNAEYLKVLEPEPAELGLEQSVITPPLSAFHHLMRPPSRPNLRKNVKQDIPRSTASIFSKDLQFT
ncbi:MAG: DUF1743 domain-containing protein [Thermoproteota archaeon]